MSRLKSILTVLFLLMVTVTMGQDMTTAAGGDASGSSGSVSISLGQIVYSSANGANGSLNPGNQQPYELFALSTPQSEVDFALAVYPNPTTQGITFEIKDFPIHNLTYQLVDVLGNIVEANAIRNSTTSINMDHYSSATYFLNIVLDNRAIKVYKVIKN